MPCFVFVLFESRGEICGFFLCLNVRYSHLFIIFAKNETMTIKPKRSDFQFLTAGHGHYKVTYTSPVTLKSWSRVISDMELIDLTKNAIEPKTRHLEDLKRTIKF